MKAVLITAVIVGSGLAVALFVMHWMGAFSTSAFAGPWWHIALLFAYGITAGVFMVWQYPRLMRTLRNAKETRPPK